MGSGAEAEGFGIPFVSSRELILEYRIYPNGMSRREITKRRLLKINERLTHGDKANAIALLPIDIAEVMGHDKIVELLRKHRQSPRVSSLFFNNLPQIPPAATHPTKSDPAPTRK